MAKQKSIQFLGLLSTALFLELVVAPSLLTKVQAQTASQNSAQTQRISTLARVTFEPPGDGKPDDTAGGASRNGGCLQGVTNSGGCIVPLMPATKDGLTTTERPTFFVYVADSAAKELFFSLRDDRDNAVYQAKIPINGQTGIVSVKLPDNAPALEVGKTYQWAFIMVGEQGLRPDSPGVRGEVRRVELNPELKSEIAQGKPLERAELYGKNGIWFDTVATLAQARREQPNDTTLVANWQDLLKSVGLDAIAKEPLL
ncbi:DUF928 domain-containing protein [Microseira sp. BLCC-F43]|jgi:hypothetical protein|uniref:DUF928 domain-containing protein n=1 Tax=Microseira sp. BLCC-F43 TaxID=3153602 RepID=UPI0035BAA311